ncbi:MAG TPA: hypothetical protein DCE42_20275 [Myxococcales bacterium]|nr:hypothetical protein [Myxococcales bacterium]
MKTKSPPPIGVQMLFVLLITGSWSIYGCELSSEKAPVSISTSKLSSPNRCLRVQVLPLSGQVRQRTLQNVCDFRVKCSLFSVYECVSRPGSTVVHRERIGEMVRGSTRKGSFSLKGCLKNDYRMKSTKVLCRR